MKNKHGKKMDTSLILTSARKAVLARLSALGRHFCSDDVAEMVSMTVERFYTRGSYDPSKSSVQTYVSRIAFSVVYDFVKAADKSKQRFLNMDAVGRDDSDEPKASDKGDIRFTAPREADTSLLNRERESLLLQARAKLSPRYREYFDLLARGRSHDEIARLQGTSVGNVGVTVHRMRRRLRTFLDEVA